MSGEKSAHEEREARLRSLKTLHWGGGSAQELGPMVKKREKFRCARHRGGRILLP